MTEDNESELKFSDYASLTKSVQTLASQCKSNLDIFCLDLNINVFATEELTETLKQRCIRQKRTKIRILIKKPKNIIGNNHRLLYLAQRLSSFFEIRIPAEEHQHVNYACVICDKRSYVYQELADKPEGILNLNDAFNAKDYSERFNAMWEKARTDINLRQMTL